MTFAVLIGVAKKYALPSFQGTRLGADQFGRDVFSRILYGARISLLVDAAKAPLSPLTLYLQERGAGRVLPVPAAP